MSELTKFVGKSDYTFETMLQKISSLTRVSPELVRKYGIASFKEWESTTGLSVRSLSNMKPEDRCFHIYNMLDMFRSHLETVIFSVKDLDKSLSIAGITYEIMFGK
ncbi:MAG: hypothetical protein ACTSWX_08295 [Promethearchaeota archaeon]